MPPTTIAIGQVCAAKYAGDNRWHRVKIVSIPTLREVTVSHNFLLLHLLEPTLIQSAFMSSIKLNFLINFFPLSGII